MVSPDKANCTQIKLIVFCVSFSYGQSIDLPCKRFLYLLIELVKPLTQKTKSWIGYKGDPPSQVTLFG